MGDTTTSYSTAVSNKTDSPPRRRRDSVPANAKDQEDDKAHSEKKHKIRGRTPSGQVFEVPETHDMVSNLLDPRLKKSVSDIAIVLILTGYIAVYFAIPKYTRVPVFLTLFALWRLSYNAGLGWLLYQQSTHRAITKWVSDSKIFEKDSGKNRGMLFSIIQKTIKKDFSAKFSKDDAYDFYETPVEYKSWLLFRSLVDLILMSDFTCYMLLVFACASKTTNPWPIVIGRWVAGIILFFFNLWVKLDAHRVVKDYAWYWGDFFFLEDLNLTFDGVFEMAPHPMYSIGYAGYYGFCLMAASYTLFAASILAHASQFVFLILVENPHIDKTYNANPAPRNRRESFGDDLGGRVPLSNSALLVFKNFTVTRTSDILLVLLVFATSLLYYLPNSTFGFLVTFVIALSWRLFHCIGIGALLRMQSTERAWTKLFLKYGKTSLQAYEEWQALYNASTVMSYVSIGVIFLRDCSPRSMVPFWLFRYIVGCMMIALQIWTSYSIYDSLGDYGWFFGDFFYTRENQKGLTYSGIYRYLNNPERLFGIAGVWGIALISYSSAVTFLAFVWTFGGFAFIKFVEQPHMQRLYGGMIRREAGVTKTIKSATKLATPLETTAKQLHSSIDKILSETAVTVENLLDQAKPKLNGVKDIVNETKVRLKKYPAKLTINVSDESLANNYTVSVPATNGTGMPKFEYGTPIEVSWTAHGGYQDKDWIGLYRATSNPSAERTTVSSHGRWTFVDPTNHSDHKTSVGTQETNGKVLFEGDLLFWEEGTYEFRYHINGKHTVVARSEPFEIVTTSKALLDDAHGLSLELLDLIKRCAKGSAVEKFMASTVEEDLEIDDDKVLKRVAYAIKGYYGVDLAPQVILSDSNALMLANRLVSIKRVLEPLMAIKKKASNK